MRRFQTKWPLVALVLFVVMTFFIIQFDYDAFFEKSLNLPRPVLEWDKVNARNTYALATTRAGNANSNTNGEPPMSMTFIVRTYQKFLAAKSTDKLLHDLEVQSFGEEGASLSFPISAIIVATDADSIVPVRAAVKDSWKDKPSLKNVDVHFHDVPFRVYVENCCGIEEVCIGKHKDKFIEEASKNKVFGKYRDVDKKIRSVCAGNNLLHYTLTDIALKYVLDRCSTATACENQLVVATNGDNSYSPTFAHRVMQEFQKDQKIDAVMVDYLERGEQQVTVGLDGNSMDLGAMVFRISYLKHLAAQGDSSGCKGIGFLTPLSLQTNAWPHDYYGADNRFMKYLVRDRGAKVSLIHETLFTHW